MLSHYLSSQQWHRHIFWKTTFSSLHAALLLMIASMVNLNSWVDVSAVGLRVNTHTSNTESGPAAKWIHWIGNHCLSLPLSTFLFPPAGHTHTQYMLSILWYQQWRWQTLKGQHANMFFPGRQDGPIKCLNVFVCISVRILCRAFCSIRILIRQVRVGICRWSAWRHFNICFFVG